MQLEQFSRIPFETIQRCKLGAKKHSELTPFLKKLNSSVNHLTCVLKEKV